MNAKGYWRIPIIVDGSWGKRSYGQDCSPNTRVAVIFAQYTRKRLHIGIKNRFYTVCQREEKSKVIADLYRCPRNLTKLRRDWKGA